MALLISSASRLPWLQNWGRSCYAGIAHHNGRSQWHSGVQLWAVPALISSSGTLKATGIERRGERREQRDARGGDAVVGAVTQSSSVQVVGFVPSVLLSKSGAWQRQENPPWDLHQGSCSTEINSSLLLLSVGTRWSLEVLNHMEMVTAPIPSQTWQSHTACHHTSPGCGSWISN